ALGADFALREVVGNAIAKGHVVIIEKGLEAFRRGITRREGVGFEHFWLVSRAAVRKVDGNRLEVDRGELGNRSRLYVEDFEKGIVEIDFANAFVPVRPGNERGEEGVRRMRTRRWHLRRVVVGRGPELFLGLVLQLESDIDFFVGARDSL